MSEKLIGPFIIELKISMVNEDGRVAVVTCGLGAGQVPTLERIHEAIGQALMAMPGGTLMDGGDFFNKVLVREKTGRVGNFAVPAAFDYDVDALRATSLAAVAAGEEPEDEASDDDGWMDDEEDE